MSNVAVEDVARQLGQGCERAKGRLVWVHAPQAVEVYRRAQQLQPKAKLADEVKQLEEGGQLVEVLADRCAEVCGIVLAAVEHQVDGPASSTAPQLTKAQKAAAAKAAKAARAAVDKPAETTPAEEEPSPEADAAPTDAAAEAGDEVE